MKDIAQDTVCELLDHFARGQPRVVLAGCRGSQLALILARLAARGELVVAMTSDEDQALQLSNAASFFVGQQQTAQLPRAMVLPGIEASPYDESSPDRSAMLGRQSILSALLPSDLRRHARGSLLVCSAAAARRRVFSPTSFKALSSVIYRGTEIERDALARQLIDCGFSRERIVEDPGTFAVRGGIIDLYPPQDRFPSRVELFGDVIDSIRLFDPETQRTLRATEQVQFFPVRETICAPGVDPRTRILAAADAANFPSRATKTLLEEVDSGRAFFGIEALTPAFHDELVALNTYLPADALWVLVEPEMVRSALERADDKEQQAYQARLDSGRLAFEPRDFFVDADQLLGSVKEHRVIDAGVVTGSSVDTPTVEVAARDHAELVAELRRARSERGEEILGALAGRIRRWQSEGQQVVIAAGGVASTKRLDGLLQAHDLQAIVRTEPGTPALLDGARQTGNLVLQAGVLRSGFSWQAEGLILLCEEEIFGPKVRSQPQRRVAGLGMTDLRELSDDDHVVHALHGVGIYRGLVNLEVGGVPADFLLLEYRGGDRLYLPIYRMDQVQRYIAGDGAGPKLDRLGGVTWKKKRGKVKEAIKRFSEDLLQLYAQRAALKGHAFDPPDALFAEFEATFPYAETPDQLSAARDTLTDLTAQRPMDRLVCGDVGFGKTEVALRAAFHVAMSGKQVAVLAPTTVLVEQHLRTFNDRLSAYPIVVESLSRFRKPKQLRAVLAGLEGGTVDIVIGTHRLLSKDVAFSDLGLLVIDEEQRFGVAHKERIKRLRTQVDILTLTATPIPRTLQMGMVGLREISIIATPPPDRLAVRTFVSRNDDRLIRDGIQRELDRGGQVFFVHNRVETIAEWADRIARLVPHARVAVGHGQMTPAALERVMLDFVAGEKDVLVCTTIIESGLDIPKANTMFVNRADCFGLAQLYQLRGRIGRSNERAFCYLLVPGIEAMSDDARKRLATLEKFTQLGSGFGVASHDLEIRGAGDLLGARQSGHIAAVGFETYARILQDAVAELRGEPIHQQSDPEINVTVAAFIPDDYVADTGQRLELYQRLSSAARDEQAIIDLLAEIEDRYGPRPEEVEALGTLMVVKGMAAELGAHVVDVSERKLSLTLDESTPLDPAQIMPLVSDRRSGFTITPPKTTTGQKPRMALVRKLDASEQPAPLEAAKKILRQLMAYAN